MTSPQKSRKPKNNEQKDYGYASRVGSGAATKAGVSHLGFRSNGQLRLRHLVHIFYSFLWPAYKSDRQHDWISKGLIYRITLSWRLEFLIYKTHLNSLQRVCIVYSCCFTQLIKFGQSKMEFLYQNDYFLINFSRWHSSGQKCSQLQKSSRAP